MLHKMLAAAIQQLYHAGTLHDELNFDYPSFIACLLSAGRQMCPYRTGMLANTMKCSLH